MYIYRTIFNPSIWNTSYGRSLYSCTYYSKFNAKISIAMEHKEMYEIFISTLKSISQVCDITTSGNVSHNIISIKGKCRDMLAFYEKYKSELK